LLACTQLPCSLIGSWLEAAGKWDGPSDSFFPNRLDGVRWWRMLDAVGRESPQTLGDFPVAAIVQALGHDKQRVVWCAVMALADGVT
jgi:hypothetical protein